MWPEGWSPQGWDGWFAPLLSFVVAVLLVGLGLMELPEPPELADLAGEAGGPALLLIIGAGALALAVALTPPSRDRPRAIVLDDDGGSSSPGIVFYYSRLRRAARLCVVLLALCLGALLVVVVFDVVVSVWGPLAVICAVSVVTVGAAMGPRPGVVLTAQRLILLRDGRRLAVDWDDVVDVVAVESHTQGRWARYVGVRTTRRDAVQGETPLQRRARDTDGKWLAVDVPVPTTALAVSPRSLHDMMRSFAHDAREREDVITAYHDLLG